MHYEDEFAIRRAELTLGIYIHEVLGEHDGADKEIQITHITACHLFNPRILDPIMNQKVSLFKMFPELNNWKTETFYEVTFGMKDENTVVITDADEVTDDDEDWKRLH